FPDYGDEQLLAIFCSMAERAGVVLGEGVEDQLGELLRRIPRGESFGNARFVRTVFERAMGRQALRVTASDMTDVTALRLLLPEDLPTPKSVGAKERGPSPSAGQYL
ncbi:MAG: hypothetical protein QOH26_2290, partial [Actinomycetota bacterium]|nr:hypothetical protein [Actinomycetota bacterium]